MSLRYKIYKQINPSPIFILGMPKSGTTAIADLIGKAINKSVMLDSDLFWYPYNIKLLNKEIEISDIFKRNPKLLKYKILKEPNFTLNFEGLKKEFPKAKFVFILREMEDNLRSIMDRINVKGNLDEINLDSIPKAWRILFENMNSDREHYIDQLVDMWNKYNSIYLKNSSDFILCKYEDFKKNKIEEIQRIANELGYKRINDISNFLNIQHQKKGNSDICIKEFYGINYKRLTKNEKDSNYTI
jgi:hypothetical protein